MIVDIIVIALIFLELSSIITKKKERKEEEKREERKGRKERTAVFRNFKSTEGIMKEIKLLR